MIASTRLRLHGPPFFQIHADGLPTALIRSASDEALSTKVDAARIIGPVAMPQFRKKTILGVQGGKEKRQDVQRVLSNPLI